jgi:adenylylsulfate kinase
MAGKIAVTDFVCPTEAARKEFAPNFTVWMNTIKAGRFEDTNRVFEDPIMYDYQVSKWFDDTHQQLVEVLHRYTKWMGENK